MFDFRVFAKESVFAETTLRAGKAVLFKEQEGCILLPEEERCSFGVSDTEIISNLHEGDAIELLPDGSVQVRWDYDTDDNALIITNKCNSNCIMCPCSEQWRSMPRSETKEHLLKLTEYIPSDAPFLVITGGEPSLVKDELVELFAALKTKFLNTQFLFLTNGRTFSDQGFLRRIVENDPTHIQYGIPLCCTKMERA